MRYVILVLFLFAGGCVVVPNEAGNRLRVTPVDKYECPHCGKTRGDELSVLSHADS